MESYAKTGFVEMWLENGIMYSVYEPQTIITIEMAKEIVAERLRITQSQIYPIFADLSNVKSVNEDARKYFAEGDAVKYISAGAFLVKGKFMQLLATSFILINRPPIPTRFFTNFQEAIKWLEYYKNLN